MNMFSLSQFLYIRKLLKNVFPETYIVDENSSDNNTIERRRHKQKIIWFNPLYSLNVKTNVGKFFSKLVEKEILYIRYLTKICLKLAIIAWVI